MKRVEMIEEYLHDENGGDYTWHDNHGILVRCKDCKWYETFYTLNGNEFRCCCREAKDSLRNSDDYCSYGERKDG